MTVALGTCPNRELEDAEGVALMSKGSDSELGDIIVFETHRSEEAQSILEVMSQCIRSLFRIGILVRRIGVADRFQRALQRQELGFPASFDIDHTENKYSKLSHPDKRWLAERAGIANAKRRQYIQYCRDHAFRLKTASDGADLEDGKTALLSSKATTFNPSGATQLIQFGSNVAEEEDAGSITTALSIFESSTRLELPSLKDLSPKFESFQCPICFTLQSFDREKAWK